MITLQFEYPFVLLVLIGLIILSFYLKRILKREIRYRHSLGSAFKKMIGERSVFWKRKIVLASRIVTLLFLAILCARLQWVDTQSKLPVDGVDIILVLDVSGSMQLRDFEDDPRSRIDVAKEEAVRFLEKRVNDGVGVLIFAKDAVTRCPITLDHEVVRTIIQDLSIGVIDPDRTMLAAALVAGANRLKNSTAKSKIMILLTDGEPTEGDMDSGVALEIAKNLGIKVYTIGIGSETDEIMFHPFYGPIKKPKVNKELLTHISSETGGHYFFAHQAQEMRKIYEKIDQLEKTEHREEIVTQRFDSITPFALGAIFTTFFEIVVSTFFWFAL